MKLPDLKTEEEEIKFWKDIQSEITGRISPNVMMLLKGQN